MSMELNVGYYHIHLSEQDSNLCTIRLKMGVSNSPDIFQEKWT